MLLTVICKSFTINNIYLIGPRLLSPIIVNNNQFGHNHESPLYITKRYYRRKRRNKDLVPPEWPNDFLPFVWNIPVKEPGYLNSGDVIRDIGRWNPNALVLGAETSEELKKAPESVRKQFTLEFANRKDIVDYQRHHILKFMQRHPFDTNSPEARITLYTVKIRNLLEHLKHHPWAAREKTPQVGFINKRAELLKDLYYQNYERYKFIKDTLKINHTPPVLGRVEKKVQRKKSLRKLTTEYCNKIINDKLQTYHEKLMKEREEFLDEKAKIEDWIKGEEKFLGTVNQQNYNK